MQNIELGNSGLRAPQVGFGCSALLGRTGRTESLRALAAAWDEGIRFFDIARSYGHAFVKTDADGINQAGNVWQRLWRARF